MTDLAALPKPRFTRRETTSIGRQIGSAMARSSQRINKSACNWPYPDLVMRAPAFALGLLWRLRDCLTHRAPRTAHPAKTHRLRALRLVKHQLQLVSHPAEF